MTCIKAEKYARERGASFDDQSFYNGYLNAINDMVTGKLPQVELETAIMYLKKRIKRG